MSTSQKKYATKATPMHTKEKLTDSVTDARPANPTADGMPSVQVTKPQKVAYEARMRQLAPVVRLRRKLNATAKRFSNVADEVKRWKNAPDLAEKAATIEAILAAMVVEATTMPDAFLPERERRTGARQLATGTKVTLREKIAARYSEIMESEGGSALEVVAVTRGHVSVRTVAGVLVVLPRAHVVRAEASTSPADQGR